MAPAVPQEAIPALDAKVESYLEGLSGTATKSPEFDTRAADVRTMGDADIRRAAETLLANTVIETFDVRVETPAEAGA